MKCRESLNEKNDSGRQRPGWIEHDACDLAVDKRRAWKQLLAATTILPFLPNSGDRSPDFDPLDSAPLSFGEMPEK